MYAVTMELYQVPKKYFNYIDIINNDTDYEVSDYDINDAIDFIISNCKVYMYVNAVSQYL